jgi:hypothetical protein
MPKIIDLESFRFARSPEAFRALPRAPHPSWNIEFTPAGRSRAASDPDFWARLGL